MVDLKILINHFSCLYSGLKDSYCSNLNKIGPVGFALSLGQLSTQRKKHTTETTDNCFYNLFSCSGDLRTDISVES